MDTDTIDDAAYVCERIKMRARVRRAHIEHAYRVHHVIMRGNWYTESFIEHNDIRCEDVG